MSNLGFGSYCDTIKLDPNLYADDKRAQAIALVVSEEVERLRAELGGTNGDDAIANHTGGLLAVLVSDADYANRRRWFEFLTEFTLIERAGKRLGMAANTFLTACLTKLHPPNWEAIFWMRAYLESSADSTSLASQIEQRELLAAKQARAETARKGAMAMLKKSPQQLAKLEVQAHWARWVTQPDLYESKAEFARVMIDKYEALKSQVVIVGWCTKWEREQGT